MYRLFLLRTGTETAQEIHPHRKVLHSLGESIVMLLRQYCRRHKIRDLLSLLHGLERGAECDLGLSVSHIPADQAVHDPAALHIPLGILYGRQLVLRLLKGKHFLKFPLPFRIRSVHIAVIFLTGGIQADQFSRNIFHGGPHFRPGFLPLLPSEAVQLRPGAFRSSRVFLQQVKLRGKDIEVASVVLDLDVVLQHAVRLNLFNPAVNAKPMVLMDHIISRMEFREGSDLFSRRIGLAPLPDFFLPEDIRFRNQGKACVGISKAPARMAIGHGNLPRDESRLQVFRITGTESVLLQPGSETPGARVGPGNDQHPVTVLFVAGKIFRQILEAVAIGGHRLNRHAVSINDFPGIPPDIQHGQ